MNKNTFKDRAGRKLKVMMVTGAYYPEVSGAGLQCKSLISAAAGSKGDNTLSFSVATTCRDRNLPFRSMVEGVPVYRLPVGDENLFSRFISWLPRLLYLLLFELPGTDIIHLHGLSRKSYIFIVAAIGFRIKILLKLTSIGEDDPEQIEREGGLRRFFFRRADYYTVPSPGLAAKCFQHGVPVDRLFQLANGVDTSRFRPADEKEKESLRSTLGLPASGVIALSVGHYSKDKRPHLVARAWSGIDTEEIHLVFVGSFSAGSYEVSPEVVEEVNRLASQKKASGKLIKIERAERIEDYYRASDIFVLPSVREGMPNALLEAMACGLACAATRLEGVTDRLLESGCGRLFEADDFESLQFILQELAGNKDLRRDLGEKARQKIKAEYTLEKTAGKYRHFVFSIFNA